METGNKYNIYIGLLKSDMKTLLNAESVLKLVVKQLNNIKVLGFNVEKLNGFWNGKPEPCLKLSFINTFGVKTKDILKMLNGLKIELKQESILIELEQVQFEFF